MHICITEMRQTAEVDCIARDRTSELARIDRLLAAEAGALQGDVIQRQKRPGLEGGKGGARPKAAAAEAIETCCSRIR
jgi:hypothetical protein